MTISNEKGAESTLGLYIHIPFCVRKCRYCDFPSYPIGDPDTFFSYALKVIHEIRARRESVSAGGKSLPVDTVYIGGGTPSLLPSGMITEILDAVYATCPVTDDAEITIEVNPGTTDAEKLRGYRASGINRLSIGAQSFDADMLRFLGRSHNADDTLRCVTDARAAGFDNINLDLIFGIPGQSFSGWERDMETALSFSPEHLSFYSLQIEEGTPLYTDYMTGVFDVPDEICDRRMYHAAANTFAAQGLLHYELSNSAIPGHESRHNLKYWSMEPYIGFGVGAHSYFGGKRSSNTANLTTYLTAEDDAEMTDQIHINTLSDDMSEFIFLGLRRTAGIELSRFRARFGKDFWSLYGEETEKLIQRDLLEQRGDILRLTALGLDLANSVFLEYI